MNIGGAETFLMNVYRNIDREKIQFDFVIHTKEKCDYEDEINQLGGRVYRISRFSKNPIQNMLELASIIKNNKGVYKTIHRHTNSSIVFTDLLIAKLCGIKNRYVHSHSNSSPKAKRLHKIFRPLLNSLATRKFACSQDAAIWTFGKKASKNVEIIYNGIDIQKFIFDLRTRNIIRKRENCGNKKIIGHVGRFAFAKNHSFIIDIFNSLLKKDSNYELWLIGDGELKQEIEKKVKDFNIESKVKFFGKRNDINELLQAMDIFLFPSIYEGLGISLIEAQISGLYCLVSDNIQNEAIITNYVKKLEIKDNNLQKWVKEILDYSYNLGNRYLKNFMTKVKYFDIKNTTKRLQKIYLGDIDEE